MELPQAVFITNLFFTVLCLTLFGEFHYFTPKMLQLVNKCAKRMLSQISGGNRYVCVYVCMYGIYYAKRDNIRDKKITMIFGDFQVQTT